MTFACPPSLPHVLRADDHGIISPLTARKHRENLKRGLSLPGTAERVAYAARLGLAWPDG